MQQTRTASVFEKRPQEVHPKDPRVRRLGLERPEGFQILDGLRLTVSGKHWRVRQTVQPRPVRRSTA